MVKDVKTVQERENQGMAQVSTSSRQIMASDVRHLESLYSITKDNKMTSMISASDDDTWHRITIIASISRLKRCAPYACNMKCHSTNPNPLTYCDRYDCSPSPRGEQLKKEVALMLLRCVGYLPNQ